MAASYPTSVKSFSSADQNLDKNLALRASINETQDEVVAIETALKGTAALATVTATKINTTGGVHVGGTSDAGTDNLIVDGTAEITGATTLTGLVKTAGGLHVGGTSDPGTDNLVVDGTTTLTGALTLGSTAITATGVEINNVCDQDTLQAITNDGAITIKNGIVTLDKGSAIAATLAAPAATDNGKLLTVYALTAQAHTITITGSAGGTATDVATFGGAIGNSITLRAYGEKWYTAGVSGVTVA